jgi:hypothetical protein
MGLPNFTGIVESLSKLEDLTLAVQSFVNRPIADDIDYTRLNDAR